MNSRRLIFLFIFSFSLILSERSFSQHILGAVSAGINLSQVDGDEVYGFKKVGFIGGPSVIIPFGKDKKWSVTLELLFSQQGSRQKSVYPVSNTIDSARAGFYDGYRLSLNYVQIPVIVHFTDKRFLAGGLGFQYGQLVGVTEYEDYNDNRGFARSTTTLQGPYTRADIQALADVRIRIYRGFWFNVRYSYSILPIRTREFVNPFFGNTWLRKQYNNVISLRLVYIFNDILPDKNKKSKEYTD
ncbi:MAG TPA: outer membrane beta-barrel protein [Bacteroidales bacterium]|nr:outer membrane beta-barrel protein [Bacteroidales bacterium]